MFRRAVELAASGKCKGWDDMQEKLVEKGNRRALDLLNGDKIRAIFDFKCDVGRKGGKRA